MAKQYARPSADYSVGDTFSISAATAIPIASDSFDRANSTDVGSTDDDAPNTITGGSEIAWEKFEAVGSGDTIQIYNNNVGHDTEATSTVVMDAGHRDVVQIMNMTPPSSAGNWILLGILRREDDGSCFEVWVDDRNAASQYHQLYEFQAPYRYIRGTEAMTSWQGYHQGTASNKCETFACERTIASRCGGSTLSYNTANQDVTWSAGTKHGFGFYSPGITTGPLVHDYAVWQASKWVPPPTTLPLQSIAPAVSDSFNRADGSLGSTDGDWPSEDAGGSDYIWSQAGARALTIVDNTMRTDGTGYTFATTETNLDDFVMECNQISNSTSTSEYGVIGFRYKDTDNYWIVSASHYAGGWAGFYDKVGGTFYGRGEVFDGNCWNVGNNKFSLMVKGAYTRVRMNDDTACQLFYEYAAGDTGYTKHGPAFYTSTVYVDNMAIWPARIYPYLSLDTPLDDAGYVETESLGNAQPESILLKLSSITDPEEKSSLILASDSFDRGDSASLGSTDGDWPSADTGGAGKAWTQQFFTGSPRTVEIISNAVQDPDGGYGYTFVYVDAGEEDVGIECNQFGNGTYVPYGGIILRYIDEDNFWMFQIGSGMGANRLWLYDRRGGAWLTRGYTEANWEPAENNKLVASCIGTAFSCTIYNSDGIDGGTFYWTHSYTDAVPQAESTNHGFVSYSDDVRTDNISIWKGVTDHELVVRAKKINPWGTTVINLDLELYEENTLIASHSFSNSDISTSWGNLTWTLNGAQVSGITDYSKLSLKMKMNDTISTGALYCSDVYLSTEEASPAGGGGVTRFMLLGVG